MYTGPGTIQSETGESALHACTKQACRGFTHGAPLSPDKTTDITAARNMCRRCFVPAVCSIVNVVVCCTLRYRATSRPYTSCTSRCVSAVHSPLTSSKAPVFELWWRSCTSLSYVVRTCCILLLVCSDLKLLAHRASLGNVFTTCIVLVLPGEGHARTVHSSNQNNVSKNILRCL